MAGRAPVPPISVIPAKAGIQATFPDDGYLERLTNLPHIFVLVVGQGGLTTPQHTRATSRPTAIWPDPSILRKIVQVNALEFV